MIHHELLLAQLTQINTLHTPASAHAVTTCPHNKHQPKSSQGLLPTPQTTQLISTFKGFSQWCRQKGHYLSQCSKLKTQFPAGNFPTTARGQNVSTRPPQAHTATFLPVVSPDWLLDSGASHHVTKDLNTLSLHTPYDGNDELLIGDGITLPITHWFHEFKYIFHFL